MHKKNYSFTITRITSLKAVKNDYTYFKGNQTDPVDRPVTSGAVED